MLQLLPRACVMDEKRRKQIGEELSRLLAEQTEFFKKGTLGSHSPDELFKYERSRERVRELFAELAGLRKAA